MSQSESSHSMTALFQQIASGDRDAFDRLVHPHRVRLLSVIRLRLGADSRRRLDPEDVLQETLLRAFRGLASFEWDNRARFIAWLTTIAERTCTDCVRMHVTAKKNDVGNEVSLDRSGVNVNRQAEGIVGLHSRDSRNPARGLRREERMERLESALGELPEKYREVIVLSILQKMPTRRLAERLGMTTAAVCMLRTRALSKLRDLFGDTESLGLPARSVEPPIERPPSTSSSSAQTP